MIRPRALLLLFIWRFFFPFAFLTERIQQANYTFAALKVLACFGWIRKFDLYNINPYSTRIWCLEIMSMDQLHEASLCVRSNTILRSKRNSSVTMTQRPTCSTLAYLGNMLGILREFPRYFMPCSSSSSFTTPWFLSPRLWSRMERCLFLCQLSQLPLYEERIVFPNAKANIDEFQNVTYVLIYTYLSSNCILFILYSVYLLVYLLGLSKCHRDWLSTSHKTHRSSRCILGVFGSPWEAGWSGLPKWLHPLTLSTTGTYFITLLVPGRAECDCTGHCTGHCTVLHLSHNHHSRSWKSWIRHDSSLCLFCFRSSEK